MNPGITLPALVAALVATLAPGYTLRAAPVADVPFPVIERFENLGMKDGLPTHKVHSVLPAADGRLWVGTYKGALVRENPSLRVLVHERGARHLTDPTRLLESATRIYGDQMDALWGEFVPVPPENIRALGGGEVLPLPGRKVLVEATPGHAWHHVAYLDEVTGTAFVGDVAGERYPGCTFVIPVTPPPDIDLECWRRSWDAVRAWSPAALFLTHFGPFPDVAAHLDQLERRTAAWAEQVRLSLERDEPDEARASAFYEWVGRELHAELPDALAQRYARAAGVLESWHGLARYWRKKGRGEG